MARPDRGYDDRDDYTPTPAAAAISARRHALDEGDWGQPTAAEAAEDDRELRRQRARQSGWGRR